MADISWISLEKSKYATLFSKVDEKVKSEGYTFQGKISLNCWNSQLLKVSVRNEKRKDITLQVKCEELNGGNDYLLTVSKPSLSSTKGTSSVRS